MAIAFSIAGSQLIRQLKTHHFPFYDQHKVDLWAATILLVLPLTFRAVFDLLEFVEPWKHFWH